MWRRSLLSRRFTSATKCGVALPVTRLSKEFSHRYELLHPRLSSRSGDLPFAASRWSFFWAMNTHGRVLEPQYTVHVLPQDPLVQSVHQESLNRAKFVVDGRTVWYYADKNLYQYEADGDAELKWLATTSAPISCFAVSCDVIVIQNKTGRLEVRHKSNPQEVVSVSEVPPDVVRSIHTIRLARVDKDTVLLLLLDIKGQLRCTGVYMPNGSGETMRVYPSSASELLRCSHITEDATHWADLHGSTMKIYALKSPGKLVDALRAQTANNSITQSLLLDPLVFSDPQVIEFGRESLDNLFVNLGSPPEPNLRVGNQHKAKKVLPRAPFPIALCTKSTRRGGVSCSSLHLADDGATGYNMVLNWSPDEGIISGLGTFGGAASGCLVCVSDRTRNYIFDFRFNKNLPADYAQALKN